MEVLFLYITDKDFVTYFVFELKRKTLLCCPSLTNIQLKKQVWKIVSARNFFLACKISGLPSPDFFLFVLLYMAGICNTLLLRHERQTSFQFMKWYHIVSVKRSKTPIIRSLLLHNTL